MTSPVRLSEAARLAMSEARRSNPPPRENGRFASRKPEEFKWTDRQLKMLKVLAGNQRHTMFVGGARSTKTFTFVKTIVNRAMRAPNSRHAILRLRNNAVWASVGRDTLPKVMRLCFPGVQLTGPHAEGYFKLPNGAEIWLAGLDEKERIEKILGMEFATIFFNEVSQIPFSSVDIALTRLAQVCYQEDGSLLVQRAYYDLNPTNKRHWSNVLFVLKKDPTTGKPVPDPENYAYMFIPVLDNRENLTDEFIRSMDNLPARKRKRFYEGVYSDDDEGLLWSLELIDACRRDPSQVPDQRAKVVAVDPSGAAVENDTGHDAIGIVVAGLGADGHGYVFEDLTLTDGPAVWGKTAVAAYHAHKCDHIVAEANFGGAMVEYVIKSIDPQVRVKLVNASRGKVVRAEPVSTLYGEVLVDEENGTTKLKGCKVHHVGSFPELEDEQCGFTTLGFVGEGSPNRVDALVWAITDLMLEGNAAAWIAHYAEMAAAANEPEVIVAHAALQKRIGRGESRPPVVAENELTEIYRRTARGLTEPDTVCARAACGKVVAKGDQRITDGVNVWHVGCN